MQIVTPQSWLNCTSNTQGWGPRYKYPGGHEHTSTLLAQTLTGTPYWPIHGIVHYWPKCVLVNYWPKHVLLQYWTKRVLVLNLPKRVLVLYWRGRREEEGETYEDKIVENQECNSICFAQFIDAWY